MSILASEGCFWPLTVSITSEAKINYAYVIIQGICNNFIEVNFCMGLMVWRPNPLLQHSTTMSLINKTQMPLNNINMIMHKGAFDKNLSI
jgi:hypothetical protein